MLHFRGFGSIKKIISCHFLKYGDLTISLLRTLILHEQVYKYVLSVKQHVQIIHNTKVKISIVLVQFADIYFCTENTYVERERVREIFETGFLNSSVNLQRFSANQVTITICHVFLLYVFLDI